MSTTVLPVSLSTDRVAPGSSLKIRYTWEATEPLMRECQVFVHFVDKKGELMGKDDHVPSVITGSPGWCGRISYERRVIMPAPLPDCECRILMGLRYPLPDSKGWEHVELIPGKGTSDAGDRRYYAGDLKIDHAAPQPKADTDKPATLDLAKMKMTFDEDFSGKLDISSWGPGTRWIAHTPWDGDFGDAAFAEPEEGFMTIENGMLRIEARKDEAFKSRDKWGRVWRAGLISSNDPKGNGFSQQYGYFECRAKMPDGAGTWPAFWLASTYDRTDPKASQTGSVEIDVIEYYGHCPGAYQSCVHVWSPPPHRGEGYTVTTPVDACASDFHRYGVMVEKDFITMFFDGIEVWKTRTPPEHNKPLMLLVNFALGSGWPIDKVPNPSFMYVDYVRAYEKKT